MEYISRVNYFVKDVLKSYVNPENEVYAAASGFCGIVCSWHIATINVGNFLIKYALPIKIIGGLFSVLIVPPLSVFMKDVYEKKIRPKIKFLNDSDTTKKN